MKFETHEVHFSDHHAVLMSARESSGIVGSLQLQSWETPHALVCWVYVQEAARRRGVGRAMIREAVRLSREAGKTSLILTVAKENAAAQALYRSEGFRQYQTHEKYDYLVLLL